MNQYLGTFRLKPSIKTNSGFTFIELIVVMTITAGLLALSAPMLNTLRSQVAMEQTVRQAKTEMLSGIRSALAGKSVAALSADKLDDPTLIPSHYGLALVAGIGDQGDSTYKYIEFAAPDGGMPKEIYSIEKEWPSPSAYLKEIRLKKNSSDSGRAVDQLLVLFTSPFAKMLFSESLTNPFSIDPTTLSDAANAFPFAELTFGNKDNDTLLSTLLIGTDKTLTIL